MASYPGAVVSFPTLTDDNGAGGGDNLAAALIVTSNDEIEAIETELGIEPHGACGSVAERLAFDLQPNGTLRHKVSNWEGIVVGTLPFTARKILGDRLQLTGSGATITFPEPFLQMPAVFMSVEQLDNGPQGNARCVVTRETLSTTVVNFSAFDQDGALVSQLNRYNWIAATRDLPSSPPA